LEEKEKYIYRPTQTTKEKIEPPGKIFL
jgi:hypothetical protein